MPSAKRARQAAILEAIREHRVTSQEELRERLLRVGIDVTQATVSRDVRELRLAKVPGEGGQAHYTRPDERGIEPPLEALLPTLYASVDASQNLLVMKTRTGGAQAVGLAIDRKAWPDVLGTLAGDDTILIVCRGVRAAGDVLRRIEGIVERGG